MRQYVIAFYIRLSLEDSKTDSLSIESQRLLLQRKALFLPEGEKAEIVEFIDNGHSGANFERPAMQELLELVRQNKIDCIMVKDFSRFGRNSLETGYFIEYVFPVFHTRFISVSDDFDTQNHKGDTGGMEVAFKYLISEWYSRDMSAKTKTAKHIKMQRGEYQSKICPYGYRKGASGRMEIDTEPANVVRQIFHLASEGLPIAQIAKHLYEQGFKTPGEYKAANGNNMSNVSKTFGIWHISTITRILDDERYIGTYIIGKRAVIEIGSSKTIKKDPSEWYRIPNHHPAIVSKEIFEKANAAGFRFSIAEKKTHVYPLKGKVYCGCCGHALFRTATSPVFFCRHSSVSSTFDCHGMKIKAAELESVVFNTITQQTKVYLGVENFENYNLDESTSLGQDECEKQFELISQHKQNLYEKYLLGELSLEDYKEQKAFDDVELVHIKNTCATIMAQARKEKTDCDTETRKLEIVKAISDETTLTVALAEKVVDKVYLYPGNRIEISYLISDFNAFTN